MADVSKLSVEGVIEPVVKGVLSVSCITAGGDVAASDDAPHVFVEFALLDPGECVWAVAKLGVDDSSANSRVRVLSFVQRDVS